MSGNKRKAEETTRLSGTKGGIKLFDGCINENSLKHFTNDYESDALIIRRGQSFNLKIQLDDGEFSNNHFNNLVISISTGKNPKKQNKTLIKVKQRQDEDKDDWYFEVVDTSDKSTAVISVNVPTDTLVSKYKLSLESHFLNEFNKVEYKRIDYDKDLFILFNPWCKDDEVYMENDVLRNEYVLNDDGYVYTSNRRPKPWNFAQFSDTVFRCVIDLLESIRRNWRDSAREVVRNLSSKANSFDNGGVLEGNWSGDYSGGKKPWQWNGSRRIFEIYAETKEPVKYGQCWVFSGIMNTMMRCLGIPCRSVTNYSSAHDTDNNCTFDKFFDEDMNYLEDESDDSCWNFHVWNDVWMSRPDLPPGFGGWQAVDGTPQEESRGVYRCGPASLQAIKEGHVQYSYDTRFVFAEVNADTVFWKKTKDDNGTEKFEPVRVKSNSVGFNITTKSPTSFWREDVTSDYKHSEGSLLERASVKNALAKSRNPVITDVSRDVTFTSKLPYDIEYDQGVTLLVKARNQSNKDLTVNVAVTCQLVRYTGVVIKRLSKQKKRHVLNANHEETFSFNYSPEEYIDELDENVTVRLSFMGTIDETKQSYVSQKLCTINKPDLKVEFVDASQARVKSGDNVHIKITLPKLKYIEKLSDITLNMEGSIMEGEIESKLTDSQLSDDGNGNQCFEASFIVKNKLKADKDYELIVSVDTRQITGMVGELHFKMA